jgi:hypothetical protein
MADAVTSTQQQLLAWSQHSCCCCGGVCRTGLVADNPKAPSIKRHTTARTTLQQQQKRGQLAYPLVGCSIRHIIQALGSMPHC